MGLCGAQVARGRWVCVGGCAFTGRPGDMQRGNGYCRPPPRALRSGWGVGRAGLGEAGFEAFLLLSPLCWLEGFGVGTWMREKALEAEGTVWAEPWQ